MSVTIFVSIQIHNVKIVCHSKQFRHRLQSVIIVARWKLSVVCKIYKRYKNHTRYGIAVYSVLCSTMYKSRRHTRTSFSMTFSMYSTVRTLVSPVAGHTYSSVRRVMRSSNNFSFSLTASIWPGFVRNAIRGRGHFYNL